MDSAEVGISLKMGHAYVAIYPVLGDLLMVDKFVSGRQDPVLQGSVSERNCDVKFD